MVKSEAASVSEYLQALPEDRRDVIFKVRETILNHLPDGYVERFNWGMLSYEIPLEDYPNTYNRKPLMYAALAAQKNYYALYLMGVYGDTRVEKQLRQDFELAGKKLDMGKACVRFRKIENLPLDVIGKCIASISPREFIARYEASQKSSKH
jgi:hypothetical protein